MTDKDREHRLMVVRACRRKAADDRLFLEAMDVFTVENVRWRGCREANGRQLGPARDAGMDDFGALNQRRSNLDIDSEVADRASDLAAQLKSIAAKLSIQKRS